MPETSSTNGHDEANRDHDVSPAAGIHIVPPPHSATSANGSPRARVASQIRAFQTLADECDVDWDQTVWDEIHETCPLDEIFAANALDDHGGILMDVDILLEDLAQLFNLPPEGAFRVVVYQLFN